MEIEAWVVLWCAFALVCGGLIKGTLGVGTPLLTVPMMSLVIPPQVAIAIMAVPVVVANVWQAIQAPKEFNGIKRFWPTAAGILCGTAIGTSLLATIDDKLLLLIVGLLVIAFTIMQSSKYQFFLPVQWIVPAGVGFGFLAGVIGGISSMFGPMIIIYLMAVKDLNKDQFVGVISFLYLSAVIPWALQLYLHNVLTNELLLYSVLGTAPVVLGMIAGRALRTHISESRFKWAIFLILMISGVTLLWRAFN